MAIELDALELRIVGVLIEKELSVPESYPLTLNALVAGCNQKSNRDPVLAVEDYEVEGALRSLMDKDWVTRREQHGGRAPRYAHEATTQLGVEKPDVAILSELLCRGPQAPGALKTRASRMHPFASPADVEDRLRDLAGRPVPYVELLPRGPRERQARWRHLLGKAPREPSPLDTDTDTDTDTPSPAPTRTTDMESRLTRLEERIAGLAERLDRLEDR